MKKICLPIIILFFASNLYAQDVQQGAEKYDWQTCINTKADSCINDCATSDDIHCNENCNALARDKCVSEGLNPP